MSAGSAVNAWEQVGAGAGLIVAALWWAYKPYEGISEGKRKRLHEVQNHAYTIDPGLVLARDAYNKEQNEAAQ